MIENKKTGSMGRGVFSINDVVIELGEAAEVERIKRGLEATLTNIGKLNDFMRNFDNSPRRNCIICTRDNGKHPPDFGKF